MRSASVMIGTWLVLGATAALVNCGGDDSTGTPGSGGSGGSTTAGSGGTTGGSAGSGGSTGGTAGAGGSGMQDSGADQSSGGSGGAGGSAGTAGGSGASGAGGKGGGAGTAGAAGAGGGKAGASGAGGSAGATDSGTGGSAGSSMDASSDANQCPATQPPNGSGPCAVEMDCVYGPATCTCRDPGPMGDWVCTGGPIGDSGGGDGGMCPGEMPAPGDPCPDSGFRGPCLYDMGHTECTCDPTSGWGCIRH